MSFESDFVQHLRNINPQFTDQNINLGLPYFRKREIAARELLVKPGEVGDQLFFAQSAVARCFYFDDDNQERTIWLEPEKMFIADLDSFINKTPSRFYLQYYQDTEALVISKRDLDHLYTASQAWTFFGLRLMENYHVRILNLFEEMFRNSGSENYAFIEDQFGKFLQVAPLKDIASMLNLSPVSLSRIRAGVQGKTSS